MLLRYWNLLKKLQEINIQALEKDSSAVACSIRPMNLFRKTQKVGTSETAAIY